MTKTKKNLEVKKEETTQQPEEKQEEKQYKPVSIKCEGSKTIGKPKSNKPWKKLSERSAMNKKINPRSWEQRMIQSKKLQIIRSRVKEVRE